MLGDSLIIYCNADRVILLYDEDNHKQKPELRKEEAKVVGVGCGDGLGQWLSEFKKERPVYKRDMRIRC